MINNLQLSSKQLEYLKSPYVYLEVLEGTPRSGKTTIMILKFAISVIQSKYRDHLVSAFTQQLAVSLIGDGNGYGLQYIFQGISNMRQDPKYGVYLDIGVYNKRIYFKGGGTRNDYKSIRGMTIGNALFTEVDLLHSTYIEEVFKRTSLNEQAYHVMDLNPPSPSHPIIENVFKHYGAVEYRFTPKDNPAMTEEALIRLEARLKKDPIRYKTDWKGERSTPKGVIYNVYNPDIHVVEELDGYIREVYITADGGHTDATSATMNIVVERDYKYYLYRVMNYYYKRGEGSKGKSMATMAKEIISMIDYGERKYNVNVETIYVDPACRTLIEAFQDLGYDNTAYADNNNNREDARGGKGSGVEVGISRVREMFISERIYFIDDITYGIENVEMELGNYKRNDRGIPIDDYNDIMDELRYACNKFIREYGGIYDDE